MPIRSELKTLVKKARIDIESKQLEDAQLDVRSAVSALDKAANKGIIHRKQASRRKSRLMRKLAQATEAS